MMERILGTGEYRPTTRLRRSYCEFVTRTSARQITSMYDDLTSVDVLFGSNTVNDMQQH